MDQHKKLNILAKTNLKSKPLWPVYLGPIWSYLMKKTGGRKSHETVPLRGHCHEIFELWIFKSFNSIWVPDQRSEVVLILNSFSPRYSTFYVDPPHFLSAVDPKKFVS